MRITGHCENNWPQEIACGALRERNGREAVFAFAIVRAPTGTRLIMDVGGAAFRDAFGGAFSWCGVCKKHLAMATCGAGWCAQCYASAAQGSIMLTLAVHDAAGCKCRGRGAQTGSLLSPPGAASSATTLPGAYAQALGAAALPQATRVAFGQCQYLVFARCS